MHRSTRVHTGRYVVVLSLAALTAVALATGCSSGSHHDVPAASAPPALPPAGAVPNQNPQTDPQTGFTRIVAGSQDSVGSIPGSAGAQYGYRFQMTDPNGSNGFKFQDRDLSFYFRPTPAALHFQVENRQNRTVSIEWDRCTWVGWNGTEKVAHGTTRYSDRYATQVSTQIFGLQRYSDYAFPMSLLVDPGSSTDQLHRVLFPEDQMALQYADRSFGVDLVFNIENRLVPYSIRFKVASVVPR